MEKETLYLKCIFEDGLVYFKISVVDNADDEYIFEGTELIFEKNSWAIDFYDLTREDIEEMYEDNFCNISKEEYDEAFLKANLNLNN